MFQEKTALTISAKSDRAQTRMKSQPTREYLSKDYEAIRRLLVELGMVKQGP